MGSLVAVPLWCTIMLMLFGAVPVRPTVQGMSYVNRRQNFKITFALGLLAVLSVQEKEFPG